MKAVLPYSDMLYFVCEVFRMQISRLFEIVYLLLDKKCMTAQQLADRFEVSVRTIYRDIDTLSQASIPVYASRGKGGGIRLTDNFVLNKSVLSEEEQNSILSALYGMNAMQPGQTGEVLEKLSALFGGRQYDWIEIDFPHGIRPTGLAEALHCLRKQFFHGRSFPLITAPRTAIPHTVRRNPCALFFAVMTGICMPGAGRAMITAFSSSAGWTA